MEREPAIRRRHTNGAAGDPHCTLAGGGGAVVGTTWRLSRTRPTLPRHHHVGTSSTPTIRGEPWSSRACQVVSPGLSSRPSAVDGQTASHVRRFDLTVPRVGNRKTQTAVNAQQAAGTQPHASGNMIAETIELIAIIA